MNELINNLRVAKTYYDVTDYLEDKNLEFGLVSANEEQRVLKIEGFGYLMLEGYYESYGGFHISNIRECIKTKVEIDAYI